VVNNGQGGGIVSGNSALGKVFRLAGMDPFDPSNINFASVLATENTPK
jgi:hypothetical protein